MSDGPLHTVSFQAAHTKSQPSPIPYHIEQGLRGEVGTTRLPSALSKVCQFFLKFIALLNFTGILWILWSTPVIAALLATCFAGISLSLAGLFHSIPYLEQRRSSWTPTNWRLLHLCFAISWAASAAVAYFLIFHPPSIPDKFFSPQKAYNRPASVEYPSHGSQCAREDDPYLRMICRQRSAENIRRVRVEQAPEPDNKPDIQIDFMRLVMTYAAAVLALGAVHGIAAYGAPFSAETGNAIWREPHGGYSTGEGSSKTPEDPEARIKRRGLDAWLQSNGIAIGAGSETAPVDKVFEEYRKSFASQLVQPPMYDLSAFKSAFKAATGKEPIEKGGVMVYQGVTFPSAGLI